MTQNVPEAAIEERQRPSVVWIIPLIALLVGGFVAWRVLSARGPEITIMFKSAEGLESGKTKVRFKDVEVGLVEQVELAEDLSGVVVRARMAAGAERYLREATRFWIVRPRIAGGQVTGLGTLLSGAYVGVDPVLEGERARTFTGLEVAPVVTLEQAGRYFVLRSTRAGAFGAGTPVFFRKIPVGQVVESALDASDDFVTTRVFVHAPYDERVHTTTRFWDASGIDASVGPNGVQVDTESIASILVGGIAFETLDHDVSANVAAPETVFTLYENRMAADRPTFTRKVQYLLEFDQSVRGLSAGAPVEFRGIQIGEVTDVRLRLDANSGRFLLPVLIAIEPERFSGPDVPDARRREFLDRLVAEGLRAQLKSGNLLTGQLIVALDVHPNASPAKVDWSQPVPEFPTIPTPMEEITANIAQVVEKIGRVPIDKIGTDLSASLAALRATLQKSEGVGAALTSTLAQTERTLASADTLIGPDSSVNSELRRALLELSEAARALSLAAEQIQTEPQSLIFGKEGNE